MVCYIVGNAITNARARGQAPLWRNWGAGTPPPILQFRRLGLSMLFY